MASNVYKKEQITCKQQLAITAIASGQNDTLAAEAAGVHRSTLNQWKNQNIQFIQALAKERNKMRDASIKQTVDRHRKLKEAAYKTIMEGIEKGDLVSARWFIENSCLENDNMLVKEIEQQQFQTYNEEIKGILENMAKDSVKNYLDEQGIDLMERYLIEEAMVAKIKFKLMDEYKIKDLANEED